MHEISVSTPFTLPVAVFERAGNGEGKTSGFPLRLLIPEGAVVVVIIRLFGGVVQGIR